MKISEFGHISPRSDVEVFHLDRTPERPEKLVSSSQDSTNQRMTIRIVQGEDTGRTCLQASVVSTVADPPLPTNTDSKTAETYELS